MTLLSLCFFILLFWKVYKLEQKINQAKADCVRCKINIAKNFVRKKGA